MEARELKLTIIFTSYANRDREIESLRNDSSSQEQYYQKGNQRNSGTDTTYQNQKVKGVMSPIVLFNRYRKKGAKLK